MLIGSQRRHDKRRDSLAERLGSKGIFDNVQKEVEFYNGNRLTYVADVVGIKVFPDGTWLLRAYEIKTGWYKRASQKARKQCYEFFAAVDRNPNWVAHHFVFCSDEGPEVWRR